ncbi:methyltransferase domain-containing protein [Gemella sp. GH3]|uniref:methyltransferase domain-containing protein n=1 Tax=unclassified Gemella TaxID=2624949 RepID=UPI0015CFF2D7|nr:MULTISPECIES: methyltransferase domain-containing protein [unclassified Gemella]MBF0713153.1 methyltransferase domain-containing protein [Gemella sp. GH3.1]NYS50105.1 methyltransferase domain-containing protein [Gemella sp. GH3]
MKIENVIKKFNSNIIYNCPKCYNDMYIENNSLKCSLNHTYDFSKKGYVHLINNYKSSKYDYKLFEARDFIFYKNFYNHIYLEIVKILSGHNFDILVDVGCGEGYYIRNLKEYFGYKYFFGIDNSKDAIEFAVKKDKKNPYMLANLSNLPFASNSVDVVLNILTPANYKEFTRIIKKGGLLIKIIPTKNYLREIREKFYEQEYSNDDTLILLEKNCQILSRNTITKTFTINEEEAKNFLEMTPLTFSKNIKLEDINSLQKITVELEIIVAKVMK